MLSLCRCAVCDRGTDASSVPYCSFCFEALRALPGPCWVSEDGPVLLESPASGQAGAGPELDSICAPFVLIGPGYEVLRAWKRSGSRSTVTRVREQWSLRLPALGSWLRQAGVDAIVPIPQHYRRSWVLGRNPARQLASWLARDLDLPCLDVLRLEALASSQARLDQRSRLLRPARFALGAWSDRCSRLPGLRVLVVDDFVTTGRTLREASRLLRRAGATQVHGFALGARPMRRAS